MTAALRPRTGAALLVDSLEAQGVKFEIPYSVRPEMDLKYAFVIDPEGTRIELTDGLKQLAARLDVVCFGTLAQRNAVSRQTIQQVVTACPASALRLFDINFRQSFYTNETIELSTLRNLSQKHIDAEECYALAEGNYNAGQYENATYYANQSKNIYTDLEEYQRAAVSDQMISDSQAKIKEREIWNMAQTGGMVLGAIVFIFGALFVVSRFRR